MDVDKIEKILTSQNSLRRVVIIRREDGTYSTREEYWYRNEYEGVVIAEGWAPLPAEPSFYPTAEIAEREALLAYICLRSDNRPQMPCLPSATLLPNSRR
ncbi:hypothetical protein GCM10007874_64290 [Labrys miyagiensis]|uniref:Uncharacterized protein n=1 Tax=Labrys miyagiensis TaxID=346912 RepID=A0ABQ6CUC4_9HYPH|nr:hypothetical protein GCM10007874_64290 [Labrys miyagiensis]